METTGWSKDLPRIPGYYWVRLPGYECAPTIAEIELHEGVLGDQLAHRKHYATDK